MPLDDDVISSLAAIGEPLTLAGQPINGLFDVAGEVVLDGVVTTATTAQVHAQANAAEGQTLVRGSVSYRVRRVLPEPPDGQLHRLVLVRA